VVLPDGSELSGIVGGDERQAVVMFGRDVHGTIVEGPGRRRCPSWPARRCG
jgi:hypothetical protein